MSGTELMDEIEGKTGWRPSPGSIYPLLARLREEGSIEQVESEEPGLKRFTLTERGRELLEEHRRRRSLLREKFHSIRRIWHKIYEEMDEELYRAILGLYEAIEGVVPDLRGEVSERVRSILERAAEEIEEVKKDLEEDGRTD